MLRPWRSGLTFIALAILVFTAIGVAAWQAPAWRAARQLRIRQALFDELRPVTLQNCTLSRFGSANDGGHLMCRNLIEGVEAAYSYDSGPSDDPWGCEFSARYQVPVHQYGCPEPARPACKTGHFVFHTECLGDRRERVASRVFDTLTNQISRNGDSAKRLIVKIDVEGAEWDSLMATPDAVLDRIDQLPVEFHGVNERRFLAVVQKLKRTFHLVNVHFNNQTCSPEAVPLPGVAYQVLFVNKRLGVLDAAEPIPALPSALNAPDNPALPDCQLEVPGRAARARQRRQALLEELRLVALQNCALRRFGSANDGGYLMCGNLIDGLEAAYSYGIGPNDDWGCEVSTRYRVPVHQYDCFDPARPVCKTGKFVFHDECVGDRRERVDSRLFDTLPSQIAANGDSGKRLIVKIDIEGAEWDSLMATSDAVLEPIDQLPMELHGVDERRFLAVLQKLKRTFYLVNLHFNNYACTEAAAPFPGWAYQVLFVNKRLGVLDETAGTPPPSALNAPDNAAAPECQPDSPPR